MKKFLRPKYLPFLPLVTGLLGFLLRLLILGTGPDADGLFPPQPVAWGLYWAMSGALLVAVVALGRRLKYAGTFEDNFPPSLIAAIGSGLAAVGLLAGALPYFSGAMDILAMLTGYSGVLAAVCMAVVALARHQGKPPLFLCHVGVSLHMALRIFDRCRAWSNETQMSRFLPMFLAMVCVMLAAYHLSTFDVGLGSRRTSLLWSLLAVHFSITTLADRTDMILFGTMAIWLLTNLCSLRRLKEPEAPVEPQEPDMTPDDKSSVSDMTMEELNDWLDQK